MAIQFVRVESMPSLGTLSSFNSLASLDHRDDLHSYVRDHFRPRGGDQYFGSSSDRYFNAFTRTVEQHVRSVSRSARKIRDSLADMSLEDIIRPCTSERSLRNLPPSMYVAALTQPDLYDLFRLGRVQGWGDLDAVDVQPHVCQWRRLIDRNGKLSMDADLPMDKEQYLVWRWTTDDPCLSSQQILDIRATREYISDILETTELDPTDLDMVRS